MFGASRTEYPKALSLAEFLEVIQDARLKLAQLYVDVDAIHTRTARLRDLLNVVTLDKEIHILRVMLSRPDETPTDAARPPDETPPGTTT